MGYLTLKLLHVLGGMVFVGNIVVTGLWKGMADRNGDPRVVAFAQRMVTVTDFVFTGLGAGVVLASGLLMARAFGDEFWKIAWLGWGMGLFAVSGLIWVIVLIPIQIKQAHLSRRFAAGGTVPEVYWRLGRLWMGFGIVATVLPLVTVYFMVFRPE